jgi:hypothetical protein
MNFVDTRLAKHYGVTSRTTDQPQRLENASAERVGFLGLGAFLTASSFSHRTSPTLRGVWILGNLLCSPPPDPPQAVPDLDDANQASG